MAVCVCVFSDAALSDQTSYLHCLSRRSKVTQWLMEAVSPAVEGEVTAAPETVRELHKAPINTGHNTIPSFCLLCLINDLSLKPTT